MSLNNRLDPSDVAYRFRSGADWFLVTEDLGVNVVRIGASSDRAVDLLHTLIASLADQVNVAMESVRDALAWKGDACNRSEVREVIARLKLLIASYGGVEIAVYSGDDQITLTPELELFIYSRTQRWRKRLLELGLEEHLQTPPVVWRPRRSQLAAAPELSDSLAMTAQKLRLSPAEPELVRS